MKTEKTKKRLVLLDSHAIIHRAYHALPDFATSKGEPTGGLYGLSTMLIKLISDLKPDYLIAAYDLPGPTHRHVAYEAYKGTRKKADGELVSQLKRSRDIFTAFNIPIYDHPGFEADDILGTIVEKLKNDPDVEIIIATGDMDTLQLVSGEKVRVFTLRKGITDTVLYDEKAVKTRFGFGPEYIADYKGLRGDPSDNIIGVKGIGEKTATDLILNFGSIEKIYKTLKKDKKALEKAGIKPRIVELLEQNEEEAMFSKMLATIRTDAPITFALPPEWRQGVQMDHVKKLFAELEFRTLATRVEAVVTGASVEPEKKEILKPSTPALSEEELAELSIMLWLIDSTKTDPTAEEVFEATNTSTVPEARAVLFKELEKKSLTKVFEEIEKPLIPVILKMNARGILIDAPHFKKLSLDYHKELASLEKKIFELAGMEFNVASPKQLGEVLFVKMGLKIKNQKKTGGGALSTKESELQKLADIHPIVPFILEHRELSKLLGTYIDPLPLLVDSQKRLHTKFLQTGTTTGRMASRDPNLQNIPNKTDLGRKIREGFVRTPGMKLVAFDYSQVELRIAAFLSNDQKLIEIFKKGEDVHSAVASQVFKVPVSEVTKEMRRKAKVINFGVMYGMGINALRANLGTDRAEAQAFYNNYFETFDGLARYLDEVKAETARRGYTETFFGRRRYFEGFKSKLPFIRAAAERMAINAPIQGTEADIIKLAMIRVDEYLQKKKLKDSVFLLLQVHDELVYEMQEEVAEAEAPAIKKIMESILPISDTKGVPIITDISMGDTWGNLEKLK